MIIDCELCVPEQNPDQRIVFENTHCRFLQLRHSAEPGKALQGAGLIVPKLHKETPFELTPAEWQATYELLHKARAYIDSRHLPDGYNLGWNCGEMAGQHIPHAHFHVLPRYSDERYSGQGIRALFKSRENFRGHSRSD
ncbi:HIT family protein [Alteribacter natronophilus]|uniref:HIT family protein n=1 Tax=Alteribacter natronophilus TaxID=2583810 RepID=UPI00110E3DFE|nr:HIT domain-containing protein [Alteribacter natronophilus]TMW72988.1 HIT domain-containing protein [Alteribacter natronophilus]